MIRRDRRTRYVFRKSSHRGEVIEARGDRAVRILQGVRRRLRPDTRQRANAEARRAVLAMLPTGTAGAEVGVWKGDFSAQLLDRIRPRTLHLIDPWSFQSDVPDAWYGGSAATSQRDMDKIYEGVRARFAKEIAGGVVEIHRGPSNTIGSELAPGSIDWVYLDGDHRYETVSEELVRYQKIVKPGGIVAGDDYHSGGWWDGGVKRAVDEWSAAADLDELVIIGTQFVARLRA